jgi:tRNA(Ile)-lysidine synthase
LSAAVDSCLERHVRPGERVLVGLSGGIDSVCLLHVVAHSACREEFPFTLSALHVHHGLSLQADRWETFCHEYCASLRVPITSAHVTVARNSRDGLEGAARRERHAAFASQETDWILLAHHRDDQAETLLFNLLRGSGVAGVAAMRERNGRLLRPFLQINRDAIEAYARHHGLVWCEDESNADLRHSRNFLRKKIIPLLEERFSAAVDTLANAAIRFAEANDLLDELARADLPDGQTGFPVRVEALQALSEQRARNAVRYLLAASHVQIPSEMRLREAVRQMLSAGPDRHPMVVFGKCRLCRRQGWLYLELPEVCADSN